MEFIINCINSIIKLLGDVLSFLFSVLPETPFKDIDSSPITEFIGYLNYLVPVTEIVTIMTTWVTAIGIYYVYQIVLRWIKVVD